MRPLHLSMEGFGTYRDPTEVDFTDVDLFALVGDTGAGKSTVIDAITFALYGTVARYEDNRAVAPAISLSATVARIALRFEVDGAEYSAVRVVQRTAKGATTKEQRLERGDDVLAADSSSMKAAVEALLGLDADQFNRTVVLPQGRFADFLHDEPRNRQTTLRSLLGLDLYSRMGQQARARAAERRARHQAVHDEINRIGVELSDERRSSLTERVGRLDALAKQQETSTARCAELHQELALIDASLQSLTAERDALTGVTAPDGLDQLASDLEQATAEHVDAVRTADETRQALDAAEAAVAAGPDLARTTLAREQRDRLDRLTEQLAQADADQAASTAAVAAAESALAAVDAELHRLETAVEVARAAESATRAELDDVRSVGEITLLLELHARRADVEAAVATGREGASVAATNAELTARALAAQRAVVELLEAQRRAIVERVGVVSHARLLAVGEPCPLCLHPVEALPDHHLDDELQAIDDQLRDAHSELATLATYDTEAANQQRQTELQLNAELVELARISTRLDGVAPPEALEAERTLAEQLAATLAEHHAMVESAAGAAAAHRDAPSTVAVREHAEDARRRIVAVEARQAELQQQIEQLIAAAGELPDLVILDQRLDEAERLASAVTRQRAEQRNADEAVADAMSRLNVVRGREQEAAQNLQTARESVATFGPPTRSDASISAEWAQLTSWADERLSTIAGSVAHATEQQAELRSQHSAVIDELRDANAGLLGPIDSGVTLDDLGRRITGALASTTTELDQFDQQRERLTERRAVAAQLDEEAKIAEHLGQLLRSDRFEAWLMDSTLRRLASLASEQLHELSGGQYSLVLDKNAFAVIDHANADEVRAARTLSGGETFLASLSLALALSAATSELAAEGAPPLESIFLDEGFGSLDSTTLDTVATAIEELGASGRLVGIITHIRELADRMPVRYEISKVAGSSTVTRVES